MKNEPERQGRESLQEQYEDALFRLVMIELGIEASEGIMAELESMDEKERVILDGMADKSKPKIYAIIDREARKRQANRFATRTLPRLGIAAACMVLVLSLGAVTVFATSATFRAKVLEFLIQVDDRYTALSLVERPEKSFDVPVDWMGDYYPSYIPDGFALKNVISIPGASDVLYEDNNRREYAFFENSFVSATNVDTEGAKISHIDILGSQGLVVEKDGLVSIAWPLFDRYFIILFEGEKTEAVRSALSIQKIQ